MNDRSITMKEYNTESKILLSSLPLFAAKGYAGTTISDLVKAASISRGLMYHYFEGKEEVFTAVVRNSIGAMEGMLDSVENFEAPADGKIRFMTSLLLNRVLANRETLYPFVIILQTYLSEEVPREAVKAVRQARSAMDFTAGLFGELNMINPEEQSFLYWSVIHGIVILRLSQTSESPLPSAESILALFGL